MKKSIQQLERDVKTAYREFGKGSKEFNAATQRLWRAKHPDANAAQCEARRARRIKEGMCTNCGSNPISPRSKGRCEECLIKTNESQKRRLAR